MHTYTHKDTEIETTAREGRGERLLPCTCLQKTNKQSPKKWFMQLTVWHVKQPWQLKNWTSIRALILNQFAVSFQVHFWRCLMTNYCLNTLLSNRSVCNHDDSTTMMTNKCKTWSVVSWKQGFHYFMGCHCSVWQLTSYNH